MEFKKDGVGAITVVPCMCTKGSQCRVAAALERLSVAICSTTTADPEDGRMSDTSRKKSTRAQRREDRKESIKAAAIEVIAERGYHNAKVSDIVEAVGVAQGTFYLYYEGKQQLFSELLQDFFTLVVSTVASWEPQSLQTRHELHAKLMRVGTMLTEKLQEHRELTSIFLTEASAVAPEFAETIKEFYDTLGAMLTRFNRILCERGVIQPMNFQLLAYSTIGQVERILAEYVVNETFERLEPAELVDHLVMFFLTGTTESIASPSTRAVPPLEEE